jgi:PAS domain S-box-containing protein
MAKSETLTRNSVDTVKNANRNAPKRQSSPSTLLGNVNNNLVASFDSDGFNLLFEEFSNPILIVQANRIVYTNRIFLAKFGYTLDEIIGKKVDYIIRKAVTKSFQEDALKGYSQALTSESNIYSTFTVIAQNGESIVVEPRTARIEYKHKTALLIVLRDLTEAALKREQTSQTLILLLEAINEGSGDLRNILQSIVNAQYYIKKELSGKESYFKGYRNVKNMLDIVDSAVSKADKILQDLTSMQESENRVKD